jgi:hypothetical protein
LNSRLESKMERKFSTYYLNHLGRKKNEFATIFTEKNIGKDPKDEKEEFSLSGGM